MQGLLIREPWIDLILSRRKTWEMRASSTKKRGVIALIKSGSGQVYGVAELVDVLGPLSKAERMRNLARQGVPRSSGSALVTAKYRYAWVLRRARRLKAPVRYQHPPGAVIWVNLSPRVAARIHEQLRVRRSTR